MGNDKALTKGFTNRVTLAEFIGISHSTLTNHFVRDKKNYHYYKEKDVMVILVNGIVKGRQRVQRAPGGHNRNI